MEKRESVGMPNGVPLGGGAAPSGPPVASSTSIAAATGPATAPAPAPALPAPGPAGGGAPSGAAIEVVSNYLARLHAGILTELGAINAHLEVSRAVA